MKKFINNLEQNIQIFREIKMNKVKSEDSIEDVFMKISKYEEDLKKIESTKLKYGNKIVGSNAVKKYIEEITQTKIFIIKNVDIML